MHDGGGGGASEAGVTEAGVAERAGGEEAPRSSASTSRRRSCTEWLCGEKHGAPSGAMTPKLSRISQSLRSLQG